MNENSYMKDVLKAVGYGNGELVVFDLDKTVFEVLAEETTEAWFFSNISALMREGYNEQTAKEKLLPIIEEAQRDARVRLVDPFILDVMSELRKRQVRVIAVTARTGSVLESATFRQLRDTGVSFVQVEYEDAEAPDLWLGYCEFPELYKGVFYKDGVMFVDGKDKGIALELFFQKVSYRPAHLVFVDDSLHNVKAVQKMAERLNIPCDGFHFTCVDDKAAALVMADRRGELAQPSVPV
ncbi:MAG: hypothetical protein A2Y17_09765 [Clostridiales bacterium GWF2_38_85]|nr:MAG: hypothetical protein A2Y17_09765 [Clostridiales bacterium GWF2_38_85]